MPDSKSILRDAQKELSDNELDEQAVRPEYKAVLEDAAACDKAHREYLVAKQKANNAIVALTSSQPTWKEKVANLNAGLTDLKKNEPVMKAPADAAAYKTLVTNYTKAIQQAMVLTKESADALIKAKGLVK